MAERRSPTAQQRRLRAELTRLRQERGLSREEVADRLGTTDTTVWRYETGRTRPKPSDVAAMLSVYEVTGAARDDLVEAAKESRRRRTGWWQRHRQALKPGFDSYLPLEAEASELRTYEAQVVPGILQTERYARHVVEATATTQGLNDMDEKLTVRTTQQERLTDPEEPLQVVAVLDEAALRRPVGGHEVMAQQLRRLIELGKLGNVTIQVLPFSAGAHAAMDGPFTLLGFPEAEAPDVVYLEQAGSGLVPEDQEEVRRYTLMFGSLTAQAMTAQQSAAFIGSLLQEQTG